jgi:hypothetical protein
MSVEAYPEDITKDDLVYMLDFYKSQEGMYRNKIASMAMHFNEHGKVQPEHLPVLQRLYREYNGCELAEINGEYKRMSTYNPDSKWDWFQVGGRWRGWLKLKADATGKMGERGPFDKGEEPDKPDYVDVCFKRDLDIDGMRAEAEAQAVESYDKAQALLAGRTFDPWEVILKRCNADANKARGEYWNQEGVVALKGMGDFRGPDKFLTPRDKYIADARANAFCPFAVLHDDEWMEKGQMGWFGHASNEDDNWPAQFQAFFDSLPDDTLLSVVDCHI